MISAYRTENNDESADLRSELEWNQVTKVHGITTGSTTGVEVEG